MKKTVKKALFEFSSIVIAVVLAMALSEWRQDILNRRQAQVSFGNVLNEVQANQGNLEPDSSSVADLITVINVWMEATENQRDTVDIPNFELSILSKAAWDVAKFSQSLTYLENEQVLSVSQVYELHDFYVQSGREVFNTMNSLQKNTDENSEEFLGELRVFRQQLLLTYNAIVQYLSLSRSLLNEYPPTNVVATSN